MRCLISKLIFRFVCSSTTLFLLPYDSRRNIVYSSGDKWRPHVKAASIPHQPYKIHRNQKGMSLLTIGASRKIYNLYEPYFFNTCVKRATGKETDRRQIGRRMMFHVTNSYFAPPFTYCSHTSLSHLFVVSSVTFSFAYRNVVLLLDECCYNTALYILENDTP